MTTQSEQAVSPVIAVILMVAVTVILSAVVGAFVFNLGQGIDETDTQNIGVQTTANDTHVIFTVITGEADELKLLVNGTEVSNKTNISPGDTLSSNAVTNESDVTVVAVIGTQTTIVSTTNPLAQHSNSASVSGPTAPTNGLLYHYEFDDDTDTTVALDSAGSNDGAIGNATYGSGVTKTALVFDGTSDYVNISSVWPVNNSAPFTVALWTRIDNGSSQQIIFAQQWRKLHIDYEWSCGSTEIGIGGYDKNNDYFGVCKSIPLNTWTHVTYTFNSNGVATLYVNGSYVNENASPTGTYIDKDSSVGIGARGETWDYSLNGSVDDVRIYDRALNASEVQDLYNATK